MHWVHTESVNACMWPGEEGIQNSPAETSPSILKPYIMQITGSNDCDQGKLKNNLGRMYVEFEVSLLYS